MFALVSRKTTCATSLFMKPFPRSLYHNLRQDHVVGPLVQDLCMQIPCSRSLCQRLCISIVYELLFKGSVWISLAPVLSDLLNKNLLKDLCKICIWGSLVKDLCVKTSSVGRLVQLSKQMSWASALYSYPENPSVRHKFGNTKRTVRAQLLLRRVLTAHTDHRRQRPGAQRSTPSRGTKLGWGPQSMFLMWKSPKFPGAPGLYRGSPSPAPGEVAGLGGTASRGYAARGQTPKSCAS